jgi:hypothetical protein
MRRRTPGLLLAVLLATAPTAVSAQRPVEVTVAHFADLTGPIATAAVPFDLGLRDYFRWAHGRLAWEALKQTAKKYGPDKVTRENITRTLTEVRALDMWGAAPAFTYGPHERRPFRTMHLHAVKGGRWVRLATVETPWIVAPNEETGLPGWKPRR